MACISSERPERYNFAAGPAMVPAEVLAQIREELPSWGDTGFSILEQPFTGPLFKRLMAEVEDDLRGLLRIPNGYHVLFLQGGASAQFGLLPLNLLQPGQHAAYVESGHWAGKAIREARRHAEVSVIASGADQAFTAIPAFDQWRLDAGAGYCHITSNETGNGLQMQEFPRLAVPLVADMTSDFLTRPIPVERFGLIYASAQKNLGVSGLCVVIVRDDLLRVPPPGLPSVFSYAMQTEHLSRLNTPPTFALYVTGLMLRWIRHNGGLEAMAAAARVRSRLLYEYIDGSRLFKCLQRRQDRSAINVCFQLADTALVETFLQDAAQNGLANLAGHPAAGGVRASLYNAMPVAGVRRLVSFMTAFERQHG
ncbi:3-phosphoserine/phosphohydroxythreonine transaminase [Stutzerimonas frequens]|uniref:Phosphoserine aminotransferase n=1 Tax=Stutzerimonas frequens TaxID=2968969 RepID=A0ABX6XRM6_9GAMM|nr:3-phosphoserine/phosphohydroxythreonine transaminase [Stutzerimonas frequens]MCQ4303411.1 3-phosphoserine/phosphohydroxythreonine transaminase [Stutzerimonas frequens]PNF49024.1 3-phosphoserine/phosphohydroxythreonine transaminase [Stutzerimonas frequens]QPT16683.1 3-phosphoserine/phosphohydroxythreonine transaminase [Stutzerimonas frequens]